MRGTGGEGGGRDSCWKAAVAGPFLALPGRSCQVPGCSHPNQGGRHRALPAPRVEDGADVGPGGVVDIHPPPPQSLGLVYPVLQCRVDPACRDLQKGGATSPFSVCQKVLAEL